jgi:hypothetical protein|tara:strand:- start:83 stop:403 length:321 start_codon:yes stop_codon:yes gene_type:complete
MSYKEDLTETNRLIREVLLPEMVNLRGELNELRRYTWPYIQSLKENNQLDDIQAKRNFSQHLDDDTVLQLLKIKAIHLQRRGDNGSLTLREFDLIRKNCPSGTPSQ